MMTMVDHVKDWDWIAQTVGQSIKGAPLDKIKNQLSSGSSVAMRISRDADALIILHTGYVDGVQSLWVSYLVGAFFGGPKKRVRTMRNIMRVIEETAIRHDCKRLVIQGRTRAWARALTGFELTTIHDTPVATKVL